jgi:putative salt-induced outer membrane protein
MRRYFIIAIAWLFISSATAQAGIINDLSSEAELGAVLTSGNTETQTINARLKSVYDQDVWRLTLKGSAYNNADGDRTTAEKYELSLKGDYKLTDISYVFGLGEYENDRFSGFKYRLRETAGYGRTLHQSDKLHITGEIGAGGRHSKLVNNGTEHEPIVRVASSLIWTISKSATLTEDATVEAGRRGFVSKSVTALQNEIIGNLSSKISVTLEHTSQVPVGSKKLDTETAITLLYKF